jgi:hypothetical protein
MVKPKYKENDVVWLAEFDNGTGDIQPRQKAMLLSVDNCPWGISYVGRVATKEKGDDGLREFTEDQIKGPAS